MTKKKNEPLFPGVDLLGAYGAGLIADHINAYWAARGTMVNAQRYELPHGGGWGVRSSLLRGLPRVLDAAGAILARQAAVAKAKEPGRIAARKAEFLG